MKKILPVAVLAAMAGVNGAQAVHVNSDGLGQVLLFPYYTTTGGQDTLINIANTTADYKAVKVRILESLNSREVLDFNLYLSPFDHWSAAIAADPDGVGAAITSGDNSCTVPLAVSNGDTIPFRNFEYDEDSIDGLERTSEGYIEIIEMGTVVIGSENWPQDIKHVDGVPGDCQDLDDSWNNGVWASASQDGMESATGGLYGYGVLIDVEEGTDATYDAVALDNFFDTGVIFHTAPGSLDPGLDDGTPDYDVILGNTVISGSAAGRPGISAGLDATSAVLMVDTISNDYVLDSDLDAGTDWVVTFPTKRDYVVPFPAVAPFTDQWDPLESESCEGFALAYVDREEGSPLAPPTSNDFSPQPDPDEPELFTFCAEANVLSFNGSNVLQAPQDRNGTNFDLEDGFENGWARLDFKDTDADGSADRPSLPAGSTEFLGLPTIGFAVQKYVNGDLDGVLSNYAGSVTHKGSRSVLASVSVP